SGTLVPVLSGFGQFTVVGSGGCPAQSHIIASHPALAGLSDGDLSNWGCSTHEGFVTWPAGFDPLVISLDVPSSFVASDGTTCGPYVVARGAQLISDLCLVPLTATNPVNTPHTVTAFVNDRTDCTGQGAPGVTVTFHIISGPSTGTGGTAATDGAGHAAFTW